MLDEEDSNDDEEDKSMDVVMDIDGAQKKTTVKYEGEEELQSEEAGSFQVNMSEQGEQGVVNDVTAVTQ